MTFVMVPIGKLDTMPREGNHVMGVQASNKEPVEFWLALDEEFIKAYYRTKE